MWRCKGGGRTREGEVVSSEVNTYRCYAHGVSPCVCSDEAMCTCTRFAGDEKYINPTSLAVCNLSFTTPSCPRFLQNNDLHRLWSFCAVDSSKRRCPHRNDLRKGKTISIMAVVRTHVWFMDDRKRLKDEDMFFLSVDVGI